MLNKRQEKIILLLGESKSWITGKEISRLMNVSDRTIRSDIDNINRFYEKQLIESNIRSGYRLNDEVLGTLPVTVESSIPQTPQERCIYIIQELLFEKKEINLLDLQDQVFISGYSIDNDIKRIKTMLEPYENLKIVRSKNCIRLEGSERSKRALYKELLTEETQGNFLNLNKLSSIFVDFDLLKVKADLDEILNKYNYHVREMVMPLLMIHIGVSLERMYRHNYIQITRDISCLANRKEYTIAKEFYTKLANKMPIEIIEDEVILFALQLMGKRSFNCQNDLVNEKTGINVDEFVDDIIRMIKEDFDIDFSKDMDLKNGLVIHLQGVIERSNEDIKISNIYLQELKRKYPLVFELAVKVGRLMKRNLNLDISEHEIGFLALHLGAAYERITIGSKYRVVMIYPDEYAMTNMCLRKVENLFSERIDIIECVSFFEENTIRKMEPDLILTTLQLQHSLDIPTIQISIFLNNEDESKIFQTLNMMDRNKFRQEFEDSLIGLIKKETFHYGLDLDTPTEVITYMCDYLESLGYSDEEFKQSVLQREEMAATSFIYSFAVPHALNARSIRPTISVAFLKKPIKWGEFEVKMVMLLAIDEEQQDILRMFFTWLSNMINDANHFASLLETKTYEEFVARIIE
ncbi:BglG family transcription antiterminator [uncultured Dubosiella sp.]|uniref:BglG family transcription antiterminator n=1 Tax=uncultured Dubosiella sp. TaxID=1937011 RepID=UPI00272FAFA9|nr:BglG family transcription antiterminator [uncultured Dubosiella sp.]